MHRQTPVVHVYPGVVRPGVGQLVRGAKLPGCLGCFDSSVEHGSFVPLIAERLFQLQQQQQARSPLGGKSTPKADIYVQLVPAYMEPFGPVGAGDREAIAKLPDAGLPREMRYAVCRTCRTLVEAEYNLTQLTAANRRRHFILPQMPLWCDCDCDADRCTGMERWAVRLQSIAQPLHWALEMDNIVPVSGRQSFMQVPFLSSIRWSKSYDAQGLLPPWKSALAAPQDRTVLMSFTGSLSGSEEGRGLRHRIARACDAVHDLRVCTSIVATKLAFQNEDVDGGPPSKELAGLSPPVRRMRQVLLLKQRSVFCIEPFGMARVRKALVDALLCGCVPVFFNTAEEFALLWPLHFSPWGQNASVRLEPRRVLAGNVDVIGWLRQLHHGAGWEKGPAWGRPSHAVRRMQASISRHAHRLMYSLEGDYEGDASDLVVRAMHRLVTNPSYCHRMTPGSWRCKRT